MRKLGLIPKKIGIVVVVFCAVVAGVVTARINAYAEDEEPYTVAAGLQLVTTGEDGFCEANNDDQKFKCSITVEPYLHTDKTSGSWEDYYCMRFIGYNFAKDTNSAKDLTEGWIVPLPSEVEYPVDSNTSDCNWENGIQHYQVGVFRSKEWMWGGKKGLSNLKKTKMNFDISYNDFIKKAEKTETEAETKYSSAICVKAYSGWALKGTATNGRGYGYWCTGVFSFSFTKDYTLTAKSISTTGESLSNIPGLGDKSVTAEYGKSASVQHGNNSEYVFKGWKKNINDSTYTGGISETYTVDSLKGNVIVYAVYEQETDFVGMIRVSEATGAWANIPDSQKNTTGWTKVNGTKVIHEIRNCNPVSGCTARFEHWLKRVAGNGDTQFSVKRTSNYLTIGTGDVKEGSTGNFSVDEYKNGKMVASADFKERLYPGQVVCETLKFKANNKDGDVSITACASALGKAQPEGPNGESTLLDLKVKNNSVSKYNSPMNEVWAKPGDRLTFSSTYSPVLQYTYSLIPEKMRINGGTIYSNSDGKYLGKDNSSVSKSMFNSKKPKTMRDWNNAYNVYSENFTSSGFQTVYKFGGGKDEKQENSDDHTVDKSEVGLRLTEKAEINYGRDGNECENKNCTTPSQVEFTSDEGGYNVANVKTDNIKKTAIAKVPYNFNTGAEVLMESNKKFFAGEKASVTFGVSVLKKVNTVTTDGTEAQAYATRMHGAKVKMIFYYADNAKSGDGSWGSDVSDLCQYFGLTNDGQNCGYAKELGNLTLEPKEDGGANEYSATVNVRDMKAGSKICAAVAVYPSSSGDDKQLSSSGSETWRISDSKCFSIAKKPSFQVWGGSVYSAGKIELRASAKNNLHGYNSSYPYNMTGNSKNRVFGSWVELGLVAKGAVKGLASGAGTGYFKVGTAGKTNYGGQGVPLGMTDVDLGGSAEGASTNYCVRSTLSFANSSCKGSSSTVGGLSDALYNNVASNKSALISEFINNDDASYTIETAKEIGEIKDFAGTVVVNDDGTESTKMTRVIVSAGNIRINGNIEYMNSGYTGLGEVPKIIIYSGRNIFISCDVSRVDAVLIAENAVNTCSDGDVNDKVRSRQLKINGSIISNTLTLGRTYGAAFGAWSIAPAEIINYDTSLYLWSRKLNATTSMDKLVEAYTKELAPRY